MRRNEAKETLSKSAASGMVALVFLVLGFQLAVFVIKVVERRPVRPVTAEEAVSLPSATASLPEEEETESPPAVTGRSSSSERTKLGGYPRPAARPAAPKRTVESFPFDPNTVTLEELQRLGLSARQAESIENYRSKGGRFRSKTDFQKMYVVSDTLYARLEPYIDIPKLELNGADSASLVSLRGIGPYYARKILDYRDRLGGFWQKEQLLEIDGFDADRYAGIADEITVDARGIHKIDLWHASDTLLARHPYLGPKGARSIIRYRAIYDSTRWSLPDLAAEHVLPQENIEKLKKYIVSQ